MKLKYISPHFSKTDFSLVDVIEVPYASGLSFGTINIQKKGKISRKNYLVGYTGITRTSNLTSNINLTYKWDDCGEE